MAKADLTASRLREVLHYDPESGLFNWVKPTGRRVKVGAIAGTIDDRGYIKIMVDGVRYYAHRLAFLWMLGEFPSQDVDHRDGIKTNTAWANLRPATRSQNLENLTQARSHNKLGVLGVFEDPRLRRKKPGPRRFIARIKVAGKLIHLGTFPTIEEAQIAYQTAKKAHHFVP